MNGIKKYRITKAVMLRNTLALFMSLWAATAAAQITDMSAHIAQKLQDSLGLSMVQRDSLYALNNRLQSQKMQVRLQYAGTDSLGYYFQRIENTRDSLYRPVLGDAKYLLYQQKKRYLISAN